MSPTQEVHETTDRPHRRKIGLLDQVEYRLAETKAEKEAIYALRYRAYLHEGAIEPRADQLPCSLPVWSNPRRMA